MPSLPEGLSAMPADTDDLALAFAPPEDRAGATGAASSLPDRIALRDWVRSAEIGAFQAERGVAQRLRFNVVVEVQTLAGALHDDVDRVLSYDTITEAIDQALTEARVDLLETLAEQIAGLVLADPRAARVFVRIEKLDRGPFALGVEIVRRAGEALFSPDAPEVQLVLIGPDLRDGPDLKPWLDRLAADPLPAVLMALPAPDQPLPGAADPLSRRRIALLGLDQAAWVLAGRDPRCLVVSSRTEIDWAARKGQMTVCAPSKLVLDAAGDTPDALTDIAALAPWIAARLHARHIRALGAVGPLQDGPHPVLRG